MENVMNDILSSGVLLPISVICGYFLSDKLFDFIDYVTKIK